MTITTQLTGKTIQSATSSLNIFSMQLDDGNALVLEASDKGPSLQATIVKKESMPQEKDAVCKVDWGWICHSKIDKLEITDKSVRFQLDKAGPLTISLQLWQGKPFLAFQPYRPG